MSSFSLPWAAWFGDRERRFSLPPGYECAVHGIRGGRPLGPRELADALRKPVESPPLAELVRGRRDAVVVCEDLTRPARLAEILPSVLAEIHRGGLPENRVRLVMGVGGHAPLDRPALLKKLGASILRRYDVSNHHPYENLVDLGTSRRGIPVHVNRRVAEADLKIAVGSVVPHPYAGFGGGAKIVLPGVAGIETLEANHRPAVTGVQGGFARVEGNTAREEMEEIALRVGLEFIVNVVTDDRRRSVALRAGHPVAAHRAAVVEARRVYATEAPSEEADVLVLNAYPKDTEMLQVGNVFNVLRGAPRPLVRAGGAIVVTAACSLGRGYHSLHGPGGRLYRPPVERDYLEGRALIVHAPLLSEADARISFWEGYPFERRWAGVLARLRDHCGGRARVSVFPCAPVQLVEG